MNSFGDALAALVGYGVGTSTGNLAYTTTLQTTVPDAVSGRVFAFYDVIWAASRIASIVVGVTALPGSAYSRSHRYRRDHDTIGSRVPYKSPHYAHALGDMPDQPEQRQLRRCRRSCGQLLSTQSGADVDQNGAAPAQVALQDPAPAPMAFWTFVTAACSGCASCVAR